VLGYTALEFGLGTAVMTLMAVVGSAGGQAIVTRHGFPSVTWWPSRSPARAAWF
jgi:hypothetical protein